MSRVDEGRGVFWEAALILQYIYDAKGNDRFIPVLLDDAPEDGIPFAISLHHHYRVKAFALSDPGYEDLYRELTSHPAIVRPEIGEVVSLPPRATTRGKPSRNRPRPPSTSPASTNTPLPN